MLFFLLVTLTIYLCRQPKVAEWRIKMYYIVQEDGIRKADEAQFQNASAGICILTLEEWQHSKKWNEFFGIWHTVDSVHYCKMESHRDFLFGTIRVPEKGKKEKHIEFALYIMKGKILLLDEEGKIEEQVQFVAKSAIHQEYTIERFLYDFLQSFISNDLLFLEAIEQEIANIEEDVLKGKADRFNYRMLPIKKVIARFYHYYSQLTEIGEEILDNQENFFDKEDLQTFQIYSDRVCRLAGEAQLLREYAMQVQEVYQSEIGLRQNNVMKILTIVTTIFLPLSLIAGWYGMNFSFMPELQYHYSYPIVFLVSILIVIVSLVFFKKKNFW